MLSGTETGCLAPIGCRAQAARGDGLKLSEVFGPGAIHRRGSAGLEKVLSESLLRLDQAFITPLDREDILNLITETYGVVDRVAERSFIRHLVSTPDAHRSGQEPFGNHERTQYHHQRVAQATEADGSETASRCNLGWMELVKRDRETFFGTLFEGTPDALEVLKKKELLDLLEEAIERAEVATEVVARVLLRTAKRGNLCRCSISSLLWSRSNSPPHGIDRHQHFCNSVSGGSAGQWQRENQCCELLSSKQNALADVPRGYHSSRRDEPSGTVPNATCTEAAHIRGSPWSRLLSPVGHDPAHLVGTLSTKCKRSRRTELPS